MVKEIVFSVIGSSAFTMLLTWALYFRKHKASAQGVEKENDKTEIQNFIQMAREWRETATQWKALADEYQQELIKQSREFTDQVEEMTKTREELQTKLTKAYQEIEQLRKSV